LVFDARALLPALFVPAHTCTYVVSALLALSYLRCGDVLHSGIFQKMRGLRVRSSTESVNIHEESTSDVRKRLGLLAFHRHSASDEKRLQF